MSTWSTSAVSPWPICFFARKVIDSKIDQIHFCNTCGCCSKLLQAQARIGDIVYNDFYKKELRSIRGQVFN
jgi:hypothetical protein